jgi:hypothetical protein
MRAAMRRVLGEAICTDSRLCITILNAMRVIGDDKALDAVETLLGMRPVGRVHARVLECARQAMPDIRIRAAEVRRSETLLRPADPSDEATLLRPADGAPSGDEERLVRPAEQATANSGQAPRG